MLYPPGAYVRRSGATSGAREDDVRSPFAKDRDRLLYSSAFRRLAGKSQVVASTEIGPFHTRLTHSLKVAQLGRRLAEQLCPHPAPPVQSRKKGEEPELHAPDPDLVEFACLAHDIGHPPFGHTGERALHRAVDRLVGQAVRHYLEGAGIDQGQNQASEAQRVIGGFEGNPQSFRIVTRLAHKAFAAEERATQGVDSYIGLDLTAAAIDAVSKYPWGRSRLTLKKWGVYGDADDPESDHATLNRAREHTGANPSPAENDERRSFECQLMDWCDDVTYAVHDVEDFYMAGMIPLDRIFGTTASEDESIRGLSSLQGSESSPRGSEPNTEGLPLRTSGHDVVAVRAGNGKKPLTDEWLSFRDYLQEKWADKKDHSGSPRQTDDDFLDRMRAGLIDALSIPGWEASPNSISSRRLSHRRTSDLIKYFAGPNVGVEGAPLLHKGRLKLDAEVEGRPHVAERDLRYQCDLLKELAWRYVINLPGLQTQQAGQARVVDDLVEIYASQADLLPHHYSELAEKGPGFTRVAGVDLPEGCLQRLAVIRAAADYVASLTEPQAVALHRRLTGVSLGGFRDII